MKTERQRALDTGVEQCGEVGDAENNREENTIDKRKPLMMSSRTNSLKRTM